MCLGDRDQKLFDDLLWPLELDALDRSMWNDKCDYLDLKKCKNLNPYNFNLLVMQLSIRSLISHQIELNQLLRDLENRNSTIDVIALNETFLTGWNTNLVSIPGYKFIFNNRSDSKGGGIALLLRHDINYKPRKDLDIMIDKEFEVVFAEIVLKNGKKVIAGSLYMAPDSCPDTFCIILRR